MLVLSLAFAAPDLPAAFRAQPPHTAVYAKESTGEPVLEVTVNGPRRGTLRALSPDGAFVVSVDPTHMRIRLPDGPCASIDAGAVFAAAARATPGYTPDGPAASGLVYRIDEQEQVDLSTVFRPASDPPLFSWHDDLRLDEVTLVEGEGGWVASGPANTWTLDGNTGRLLRMAVGDDALVFHSVKQVAPGAELPQPEAVCARSTDPTLHHQLSSQLRTFAWVAPLQYLEEAWSGLDESARAAAIRSQVTAWQPAYAEQAEMRVEGLARAGVFTDLAGQAKGRPADPASLPAWTQATVGEMCLYVAQEMARAEVQEMAAAWASKGWTPEGEFLDALVFRSHVEAVHKGTSTACEAAVRPVLEAAGAAP